MREATRSMRGCWHGSLNSHRCLQCVRECVVGNDGDSLGFSHDAHITSQFGLRVNDDIMEFGVGGVAVGTVLV